MDLQEILEELRAQLARVNSAILAMETREASKARKSNRGRKSMGAEERLVVSERMIKYWADWRKERGHSSQGMS